jgi:hypothetical protein
MAERDPRTEALRDEIYRRMSGGEKVAIAMRMREEALKMVRDSIRRQRPDISDDDLEFEVRKRYLPPGMAELTEPMRRECVRQERERHKRVRERDE